MTALNYIKKGLAQRSWAMNYPLHRARRKRETRVLRELASPVHVILSIANHFEPRVSSMGLHGALQEVREWCEDLESVGTTDSDGFPLKHTYYFPAEQYAPELLLPLEKHCRKGFGEVEVHLHHGIEGPDNAENLRQVLESFRLQLRQHGFLSFDRRDPSRQARYCFVHGNWALANSAKGRFCGVDEEMEVLVNTGCFMDCTLPSAPNIGQVKKINSIYECGAPLCEAVPHRHGRDLRVGGGEPRLPFLLQGPLMISWKPLMGPLCNPSIENGAIHDSFPPTMARFRLWMKAHVHVKGRPDWIFVKLHTHGLRDDHRNSVRGPVLHRFLGGLHKEYNDARKCKLHFASSRESANMILAAVDGKSGDPGEYRDYRFKAFDL